MSDRKEKLSFHMMHSMKGGCGKSTCALFKALQLAQGTLAGQAEVLFLDADFKGSAMQPLLFRNEHDRQDEQSSQEVMSRAETVTEVLKKMPASIDAGNGLRHRIAIPDGYRPEDNLSQYLKGTDISYNTLVQETFSYYANTNTDPDPDHLTDMSYSEISMNGYIDFILAAADPESKDLFRNYQGKIGPGIFVYRMESLFEKILYRNAIMTDDNDKHNKALGKYTDVIIDMPPGYDEYSDMLLEVLHRLAAKDKRIELHYYAITTQDIGHRKLTKDNIEKIRAVTTEYDKFTSVNAILSNPYSAKFASGTQERIQKQIQELKDSLGNEGIVYINEYNASYHEYCTIPESFEFELEGETLEER